VCKNAAVRRGFGEVVERDRAGSSLKITSGRHGDRFVRRVGRRRRRRRRRRLRRRRRRRGRRRSRRRVGAAGDVGGGVSGLGDWSAGRRRAATCLRREVVRRSKGELRAESGKRVEEPVGRLERESTLATGAGALSASHAFVHSILHYASPAAHHHYHHHHHHHHHHLPLSFSL
jgi:hypothetical protein